ncbi:MAG TPA: circularly permuted type 2 ATP-grasp protein, partial [Candidatus Sulfotelmatobacter sp.]|nr:circularly permuted type 2 ATP-grasp protein [Candidatus Sulfotelmatobacter sp.]
ITLVEGADLTVRDRAVFLKTVAALEPVDVILRRLDDVYCDPLELRPDSTLGVAGLIEAMRAGTVTVANALGSGALQARAFKPFLPALCQELLGEPLALPDVASWWCGGEAERDYVTANLDRLVIKSAFPGSRFEPIFGAELGFEQRAALIDRIKARPLDFIGQERVALSSAPTWSEQRLQPRPLVLRVFVAAGPERFVAMPGGLTRVSSAMERTIVSMQRGGGSKDTWVLGEAPAYLGVIDADRSNVVPLADLANRRLAVSDLPSRVADGLFWVGRYVERVDGLVRLLRAMLLGLTDATRPWALRDMEPLLNLAAWLQLMPPQDPERVQVADLVPLVRGAVLNPGDANGVRTNLGRLLQAAASLRDRLPPDCWRAVTSLARERPLNRGRLTPVHVLLQLDELVTLGAALWGAVEDTMPRDAGWRFLDMGKRIERAMHLLAIVRGTPAPTSGATRVVRLADEQRLLGIVVALTGARLSARGRPDWVQHRAAVLDAALNARHDPRSLVFQLAMLDEHLDALPPPGAGNATGQEIIGRTRNLVRTARAMIGEGITTACTPRQRRDGEDEAGDPMIAAFAALDLLLPEISNLIAQAYFVHAFARPA